AGGFEALVPTPARVEPRTPAEVLAMAAGPKRENPQRTAAQVVRILRAQSGWAPSERTLQRHFRHLELDRDVPANPPWFGRFAADRCNELWVGDALCRTRHKASSGYPSNRRTICRCCPNRRFVQCPKWTTHGRPVSFWPGSAPTRPVWTTWTG